MSTRASCVILATIALGAFASSALAQGQDSTPGERYLRVMAEMLPGHYDNANQHYFDGRRRLPAEDRHERVSATIRRIDTPAFGRYVFLWVNQTEAAAGSQRTWRIATLEAGPGAEEVTMRFYLRMQGEIADSELPALKPADLRSTSGCEYVFVRRAEHFVGRQRPRACQFEWEGQAVYTDNEIQLSRAELWFNDHKFTLATGRRITGTASGEPYWLERSRTFHCYADVPGVGGGVATPFQRYDGINLHDKGDTHWFRVATGQEIGLGLRAVTWHVLNEASDDFNRNSLVLSVSERLADGSVKEHGYAFTDPHAERIAINLKWILANCAITSRRDARPEM
ncbi:MAG: hypothetical protein FIB04_12740 [Gammaproteobacteria bacterium]|nr:hypothetical protein [Gammaproteobacteria bacterium]